MYTVQCAIAVSVVGYAIPFSFERHQQQKIEQNEKAIELTFEVLMKLLFCKHKKRRSALVQNKRKIIKNRLESKLHLVMSGPQEKLIFSFHYFVAIQSL